MPEILTVNNQCLTLAELDRLVFVDNTAVPLTSNLLQGIIHAAIEDEEDRVDPVLLDEIDDLNDEIDDLRAEVEGLQEYIQEKDEKIEELEEQIAALRAELVEIWESSR